MAPCAGYPINDYEFQHYKYGAYTIHYGFDLNFSAAEAACAANGTHLWVPSETDWDYAVPFVQELWRENVPKLRELNGIRPGDWSMFVGVSYQDGGWCNVTDAPFPDPGSTWGRPWKDPWWLGRGYQPDTVGPGVCGALWPGPNKNQSMDWDFFEVRLITRCHTRCHTAQSRCHTNLLVCRLVFLSCTCTT